MGFLASGTCVFRQKCNESHIYDHEIVDLRNEATTVWPFFLFLLLGLSFEARASFLASKTSETNFF